MEYRQMGRSGVRVSSVGLGANQFGRGVREADAIAIVNRARELGVNFIDTAEVYAQGLSEELIGKAISHSREEFVLGTKTGNYLEPPGRLTRRQLVQRLEGSLRRLGTDHVDVYYLHFPDPGTPLDETLRALEDAVRAGKVLYPALSNHPAWQVAEIIGTCQRQGYAAPVVVQDRYNLLVRDAEAELLPACGHFGLSLVPYSPLAGGFLTGKYRPGRPIPAGVRAEGNERFQQSWLTEENFRRLSRFDDFAGARDHTTGELAMAWLLAQPLVCSVIAGVTSIEQLEVNVRAAEWRLTPDDVAALETGD